MLLILLGIILIALGARLFSVGIRAAWGIGLILLLALFVPGILFVLFFAGLIFLALPLLVVFGVVALIMGLII